MIHTTKDPFDTNMRSIIANGRKINENQKLASMKVSCSLSGAKIKSQQISIVAKKSFRLNYKCVYICWWNEVDNSFGEKLKWAQGYRHTAFFSSFFFSLTLSLDTLLFSLSIICELNFEPRQTQNYERLEFISTRQSGKKKKIIDWMLELVESCHFEALCQNDRRASTSVKLLSSAHKTWWRRYTNAQMD